jgi:hypothetical protein
MYGIFLIFLGTEAYGTWINTHFHGEFVYMFSHEHTFCMIAFFLMDLP